MSPACLEAVTFFMMSRGVFIALTGVVTNLQKIAIVDKKLFYEESKCICQETWRDHVHFKLDRNGLISRMPCPPLSTLHPSPWNFGVREISPMYRGEGWLVVRTGFGASGY